MMVFHSKNHGIAKVVNAIWGSSKSKYLAKVDNDTLVPEGWLTSLINAMESDVDKKYALLGGFHWMDEDWDLETAKHNIEELPNGNKVLRQPYIGGCSYLMRGDIPKEHGLVAEGEWVLGGWTEYQQALTDKGLGVGYLIDPFIKTDHLDDPRHPDTLVDPDYLKQLRGMTPEQCADWYRKDAQKLLYSKYNWKKDSENNKDTETKNLVKKESLIRKIND